MPIQLTCRRAAASAATSNGRRPCPAAFISIIALALMAVAGFALAACGSGTGTEATPSSSASAAAPEITEVSLIMDWVPWVLDIPVDVAQEKGYYADHGLTVKQVLPGAATDVVKFVATGKAEFGLYYAPDTLAGAAEGASVVSVSCLMSHAPVGMAMAPGVHAESPADLRGMVAGVVMIPSTRASFATMLEEGEVDADAVKVADSGFDLVAPLLAGKYDAVAVTEFGELVQAEASGQELDYLDFRDWGTPDYAFLNVLTEQGFASEHPATVRTFVAATIAGLEYAVANPEEAVDIYVARHPELKKDLLLAQWRAAIPFMAVTGEHAAGWQDVSSWDQLNAWMVESGQLEQPVEVTGAVTNEYLPEP